MFVDGGARKSVLAAFAVLGVWAFWESLALLTGVDDALGAGRYWAILFGGVVLFWAVRALVQANATRRRRVIGFAAGLAAGLVAHTLLVASRLLFLLGAHVFPILTIFCIAAEIFLAWCAFLGVMGLCRLAFQSEA